MSETKDIKITSAEKVKDPRRVEAVKKLGAISRQAKEAKRTSGAREVESGFQISNLANVDPLTAIGVVGVIGMVAYYGYYRNRKGSKNPAEAVESVSEPSEPKASAEVVETPADQRVKPKRVYRQLDTLD